MKRLIYTASALCIGICAMAQQALTLDDCVQLALENNSSIKVAKGNVEAAKAVKSEAFTKYFPTVEAQGLYFHANKPIVHYDVFNLFTIDMLKKGTAASVTAVQPLFAGGRIVNGNKLAEIGVEAGQLQQQSAVDNVVVTTEKYYWQIATLKAKKSTLTAAMSLVDSLSSQVSAAVKAGIVNRNDLLKVNLRKNELANLMVDLDNGINLATNLLAQYIGKGGQQIDVVAADVPQQVPAYPSDLYVDESSALASTVDYQLLNKKVRAAELEKRMAVGSNLPTIGLGGGLFYDDILNEKYSFGAVFVSVNVPISDWWGGSKAIKKRKIELANAQIERDNLSQMIELRMQNSWDNLTAAHRKMTIAHESIDQAAENLRLSRNHYNAGMSTMTDLLDAEMLYRKSMDQYTEAYGDFCVKRAEYINDTGRASELLTK